MSEVTSINPEEFVENSDAQFFQIFLVTSQYHLSWTKLPGFENIEVNGLTNMQIYRREVIVEEYYNALRAAKREQTDLYAGNLEIVALPNFRS